MTAIADGSCRYRTLNLAVVMSEIGAVIEILPSTDGIAEILTIAERQHFGHPGLGAGWPDVGVSDALE
jgi:hypothetical protein